MYLFISLPKKTVESECLYFSLGQAAFECKLKGNLSYRKHVYVLGITFNASIYNKVKYVLNSNLATLLKRTSISS